MLGQAGSHQHPIGPVSFLLTVSSLCALSSAASSPGSQIEVAFRYYPVGADGRKGPGIARVANLNDGTTVQQRVGAGRVYYEDSKGQAREASLSEDAILPKSQLAQVFNPGNPVPAVCHPYDCYEGTCEQGDLKVQFVGESCHKMLTVIGQGAAATVCNMTDLDYASCLSSDEQGGGVVLHPEL